MKMKKKILSFLLICLLVLSSSLAVWADEFEGQDGWLVTFDSEKLVNNVETADEFTEVLKKIQPGDTVTIQVALQNASKEATDWYMKNEVLNSFEKSVQASGGAYSYILSYIDADETETVIYNSNTVGGDEIVAEYVGLEQATISLTEYFYVTTLDAAQGGKIALTVGLDGETNGNVYQDAVADLKLEFAVELSSVSREPAVETRTENKYITVQKPGSSNGTQTGDRAVIWPYVVGGAAALVLVILLLCIKKRKGAQK